MLRIFKNKLSTPTFILLVTLLVVGLLLFGYISYSSKKEMAVTAEGAFSDANQLIADGNLDAATESARLALENEPNNLDYILALASLIREESPQESQELYRRAYEMYIADYEFDIKTQTVTSYYAAATLAEDAGINDKAIEYYQAVIDNADPKNDRHTYLVSESQASLVGLQE